VLSILACGVVASAAIFLARPVIFLAGVWASDQAYALPDPEPGKSDFSRLEENTPKEVIAISTDKRAADEQVAALILRAKTESLHVSISGARHSMGGHTLYPGALVLDMLSFDQMSLDSGRRNFDGWGRGALG
jgi:hypothetical protein